MTEPLYTPIEGEPRGLLPIAPQGWPFIFIVLIAWLCVWFQGWMMASAIVAVLFAFVLNFFRDPERNTPEGDGLFVSPADGKVIHAERIDGVLRVDIFMNVFNVHVNRAPMSGTISDMHYYPGKFFNASLDKASEFNERNRFVMTTPSGSIAFTQIAGLVARRIVSYVKIGDTVKAGQRVGMIRFGSRVNCEIPDGYDIHVRIGQHVRAGETILASPSSDTHD